MNKKHIYFVIFILYFIFNIAIFIISGRVVNLSDNKTIVLKNFKINNEFDNLNYRIIKNKGTYIFETNITLDDFNRIKSEYYKLIIYRLSAQCYKVYFNNLLIGSAGALDNDKSNIWNSINSFDIDKNTVKDTNSLRIEIIAGFDLGLLSFPPLIMDTIKAADILNWFNLILINMYICVLSAMLIIFLLLILMIFLTGILRIEYLLFSLSALFFAVYIFDNISIYHLPFSLLAFKKIITFSQFLSCALLSMALFAKFKSKLNLISSLIVFTASVILLFLIDLYTFKILSKYFGILLFLNIITWIIITAKNFILSLDAKILFFLSILILILALYDYFFMSFQKNYEYNYVSFNIYGIMFFAVTMLFMVVFDYIGIQNKISYEKEKTIFYQKQATKDLMTDCFNHQFIIEKIKEIGEFDSIIMIDIDNFKHINDNYGHPTGDFVIKSVAANIKDNIRNNDILARYGGDEFMIILPDCDEKNALLIAENISNCVILTKSDDIGNQMNITLSIGIYKIQKTDNNSDIIHKIDRALYLSKKNGKNRISFYSLN